MTGLSFYYFFFLREITKVCELGKVCGTEPQLGLLTQCEICLGFSPFPFAPSLSLILSLKKRNKIKINKINKYVFLEHLTWTQRLRLQVITTILRKKDKNLKEIYLCFVLLVCELVLASDDISSELDKDFINLGLKLTHYEQRRDNQG